MIWGRKYVSNQSLLGRSHRTGHAFARYSATIVSTAQLVLLNLGEKRDLGQWYRPFTRPRGWVTEAWYYHLASLKSLLGKQTSDCCGSEKKVKTGWDYELFHGVCPTKSEKFIPWSVSYCNSCQHLFSLRPPLQIITMDEVSKIGKISKQWTGLLREAFTDSDNFGIQFPMDLDVRMKAVMIGACFLIVSNIIISNINVLQILQLRSSDSNV